MPRRPKAEFEITAVDKARTVIRGVDSSLSSLTRTVRAGTVALGGLTGGIGLAEVAQLADRYNQLSTRIRTATKETGDFEQVQRALLATSVDTGTELENTVDTFQALARVREDIGATNAQMIQLTQTVQQLGVIGGTSSESLANGLRQFNQAIAAGVFRAEEFNSIVENTPELAKRLADGFRVTQGQLRQMVLDGKLFATDVINVLLRQAPEIAAEFQEIPSNLDRAFNSLQTAIGSAFSQLDQKVGLTNTLAAAVERLADNIAVAAGTAGPELQLKEQLADLREEIDTVNRQVANFRAQGIELPPDRLDAFTERLRVLQAQAAGTEEALKFFTSQDVGEVSGGAGGGQGQGAEYTKGQAAADKHFATLIAKEQEYLDSRQELRIRGVQELAAAIAAEEEALLANELARALGFEDTMAQARFEREQELHLAKLERNTLYFEEELAQALGFEDARHQALEQQEEEHQRRMIEARHRGNALAQKAELALLKFEKANSQERTTFILQQAQALTAGLATQSKTAFNINKAASLAEAIINTATGVTKALASYDFVGAALIAAMGAAQIATISSTQFGGASSGSTSFGAGSGIPSHAGRDSVRDVPVVSSEQRNTARITLELVGGGGDDVTDAVMRNIRARVDDGDGVIVSHRSRQAIELQGG